MNSVSPTPLLQVTNASVGFQTPQGLVQALSEVSLDVERGQTMAVVGESGSGKSVLARAILRILPGKARISPETRILFNGVDLATLAPKALQQVQGRAIAMVFQDPMSSLNPFRTIGSQLVEGMRLHLGLDKRTAEKRGVELLDKVGISSPARRLNQYPHELSGGMRQRVVIAMAISCEPELLIADEPTTALDVTVQAEVLQLLGRLQREQGMAMILITHDMGVAAHYSERMTVMYAGQVVEQGATSQLLQAPVMPYTRALLSSIPRMSDAAHQALQTIPGRPPGPRDQLAGCRFQPRCTNAMSSCAQAVPKLVALAGARSYRCWNPLMAEPHAS